MALPVEGIGARRLAAFKAFAAPTLPRLVVTSRRARALGLEVSEPVAITLNGTDDSETLDVLVAAVAAPRPLEAKPASAPARAAITLAKFAQRLPALLVTEADASGYADPPLVSVDAESIARFRRSVLQSLAIASEAQVPLHGGHSTRFVVFRDAIGGSSVAVVVGKPDFSKPVPVRLHSACLTGDVFGSRRCDCGDQLKLALARLDEAGGGVILYLEQEGRGVGLVNKMRAYQLQDGGLDTVDANTTLGFDDDERDYGVAARMLKMLGCTRVRLLTNNPAKVDSLAGAGIDVTGRLPLYTPINADNRRYLTAKLKRAGHRLDHLVAEAGKAESDRP
ncbi:MAG TPA: GTP cyclohydrolase II [Xanthobacteraceae bacterium]|nr:GTP cyclohydrolase II [Xanthobacteraceae bacterium]